MRKNKVFKLISAVVFSIVLSAAALFAFGCNPEETPVYYTVTFQTNGGSAVSSQQVESGKTATKPNDPTKDGYAFGGWYSDEQLKTDYAFTTAVTADVTVYAKWNDVEKFNVTFDTAGGTPVTAQTVESGKTVTKPEDPTKDNYTFTGWITTDGTPYDFNTPVTKALTLYANWTKVNEGETNPTTYTVTFDMQGHGTAPAAQTVAKDGHATAPATAPTEEGWTFEGWYKEAACTNVFDFETETITAATTVYAKWTEDGNSDEPNPPPVTYTVTFDMQGHGTAPAAQTVAKDGRATAPTAPTEEGWTFGGWYKEAACTNVFDFETETITANTTVYAKWTKVNETDPNPPTPPDETVYYIVTFVSNCNDSVPQQRVESGKKAALPETPANSGYVFAGWYENESFTGNPYDFTKAVSADITLYAKWTNGTFTVTFDSKGGKFETMENREVIQEEITNGSKAVEPTAPVKANSTFAGWYDNENCEGTAYDFNKAVSADITLYAKWTGGSTSPETPAPSTKTDNYTYNYSAIASSPADKAGLTQDNFTGDNAFLQITTGKVTYRNKAASADGKSPDCIESKDDGIKVTFNGTGTITISFASTGGSNTSSLELRDAAGNAIKSTTDNGANGVYTVTGTTATTVTFNVTEAGTYTIYCKYEYTNSSGAASSRGARITAITMSDTYAV